MIYIRPFRVIIANELYIRDIVKIRVGSLSLSLSVSGRDIFIVVVCDWNFKHSQSYKIDTQPSPPTWLYPSSLSPAMPTLTDQ